MKENKIITIQVLEKKPKVKKYEDYIRIVEWRRNDPRLETIKSDVMSFALGTTISLISLYSIAEMANFLE